MRRPSTVLPLLLLLVAGVPSLLTASRLSLPSIPDFRLPSAGVVNTVFPAATGGAAPYSYGVSGLPPGISFFASTRGASGTLPTVSSETTYTVTYSVTDGAGASASVSFSATVVPPPAPPPPPSPPPPPPLPPPSSLSLPTVPDFTLPSGGSVDTVFPAATGGAPPYGYGLSGQPPGISFAAGTRRASGTLPAVSVDTDYTVTYSVRDGTGATASVTFTTTVTAPPPTSRPVSPPGPPLPPADPPTVPVDAVRLHSLPFTVSETGEGQKEYRFRLESRTEVSVSLTGMDRDIDCRVNSSTCTNRGGTRDDSWSGTLSAGTHTITVYPYNADTGNWTLSVSGTSTSPQPSDPPTTPVDAVRLYSLPFTVSETDEGEKEYRFSLSSSDEVTVSLTGMNRDIDCRVNSSRCTNRGGTRDDSWSGTLSAGTHTVTVYPYNADTGNWTLSVTGTAATPPPGAGPSDHASRSRTYALRLSARFDVSVRLTGMTSDFDCRVGQSDCTNQSGTADDSWSGTLDAGDHKIVVIPRTGASGSYTLTVSVETPGTGGSEGTRTEVTTLVDVSRTGVSSSQTHSFALSRSAEVEVALTGLTIDFDCRVGSSRCTNRWGTRDDSWSGTLGEGNHSVVVYPYDPGPGDYSLTVTAITTVAEVLTPTGVGPGDMVCDQEGEVVDEDSCVQIPEGGVITVTGEDPGEDPGPPPGAGPGEGDPGPGDGGDGGDGGGGGGGPPAPTPSGGSLAAATSDINCEGWNIDDGDGFDALRRNRDGTTRRHRAIDIQVSSDDASFFALAGGTIESNVSSADCGDQTVVRLANRKRHVYCHVDPDSRLAVGTVVNRGDRIATYGPSGTTSGPHLHLRITDENYNALDPVEEAGGESAMMEAGFSFTSSDSEHCAEE